jgi:hypothetical protein
MNAGTDQSLFLYLSELICRLKLSYEDSEAGEAAQRAGNVDCDHVLITKSLFEKLISHTAVSQYFRRTKQFTVKG